MVFVGGGRGRGFAGGVGIGCRRSNDLINRATIVILSSSRSLSSVSSLSSSPSSPNNNNRNNSTTTSTVNSQKDNNILNSIPTSIRVAIPNELSIASIEHWIGHFSGTHEIQALKKHVQEASLEFDEATNNLVNARKLVDTSLQEWQNVSGQHSALLQRKESWTATDAENFTSLIQKEVGTKKRLEQAKLELQQAETIATQSQISYMNKLRQRYQEEQSWQDHWRVLGTYGTWSLIGLNSIVFLGSQFFHRRREQSRMDHIEQLILGSHNNNNNYSKSDHVVIADVHDDEKEEIQKDKTPQQVVTITSKTAVLDDTTTTTASVEDHFSKEPEEPSSTTNIKSMTAAAITTTEKDHTKTKEEESSTSPVLSDTNNITEAVARDEGMETKEEDGEKIMTDNKKETPSIGSWKKTIFASQFWKIITFSSSDEKKTKTEEEESSSDRDDVTSTIKNLNISTTKVKDFMTRTWSKTLSTSKEIVSNLKDEEIHIPSAMLGASVMGVLVIVVSIVIPPSNRR